jgi:hypothetical protein
MTERGRMIRRLQRAIAASSNPNISKRARHTAARRAAALAEGLGLIDRPAVCQACFHSRTLFRHHPDHSHPIAVVFLCEDCHRRADILQKRKGA